MNAYLASSLVYGAAAAAAVLLASAPIDSRADDITIDKTPFVSTASRAQVRADSLKHSNVPDTTEWGSQMSEQRPYKSSLTTRDARAAYLQSSNEVKQLNGEDSGSYALSHQRRDSTSVMGGPGR